MEFFENNPNTEFRHAPIDEWVREQYLKQGENEPQGKPKKEPQDVRRAVRELALIGRLIKVRRGVFKYDPDYDHETDMLEFPEKVKQAIFKRDNYRCVVCGLGREDGIDIAADHKIPRTKDGTNTLENGQTLCYKHNSMKKDYSQTEAGKRYFIEIYETALEIQDEKVMAFCEAVFNVYDDHDVNGHIDRPDTTDQLKLF